MAYGFKSGGQSKGTPNKISKEFAFQIVKKHSKIL